MFNIENEHLWISPLMGNSLDESRNKSPSWVIPPAKNFGELSTTILSEFLFFFLDIDEICKHFFNVNKQWLEAYKTHLNVRIYLLSEETKAYEEMNVDIVEGIREKRLKHYDDYEIDPPSKELAVDLLDSFNHRSISCLRWINKSNKYYEFYAAPLVLLFGDTPARKLNPDGTLTISFWEKAFKIMCNKDFFKRIKSF